MNRENKIYKRDSTKGELSNFQTQMSDEQN